MIHYDATKIVPAEAEAILPCESEFQRNENHGCCRGELCVKIAAAKECSRQISDDEEYCSAGCYDEPASSGKIIIQTNNGQKNAFCIPDDHVDRKQFYANEPMVSSKEDRIASCDAETTATKVDYCLDDPLVVLGQDNVIQGQCVASCYSAKDSLSEYCACIGPDIDCHDRLSLPHCSSSKKTTASSPELPEPTRSKKTCPLGMKRALEKYGFLLQQGLCVCRSILDRADPCCSKKERANYIAQPSLSLSQDLVKPQQPSGGVKSLHESCCESGPVTTIKDSSRKNSRMSKSCCKQVTSSSQQDSSSCRKLCQVQAGLVSDTSSEIAIEKSSDILQHHNSILYEATDLEKGPELENVILSIQGMTCTSCARKITKILSHMVGISSVNVNFITAKGEFLFDPQSTSISDILTQLKKETGFDFTRLQAELEVLDLIMTEEKAYAWMKSAPDGVHSIEKQNRIYHVTYDPRRIGARTLFELSEARALGPPRADSHVLADKKRLAQMSISFIIALVFTIPVVVLEWSNNSIPYGTRSIVAIIFATIVQAIAIPEFYIGAVKSLIFSRIVEMDMLVTISTIAAYSYSVVAFGLTHAGYILEQGEFFETSTLLILLVILGRLVSAYAKHKAVAAVSLKSLQAGTARLVLDNRQSFGIDARLLQYGDVLLIPPHTRIVTDGEIITGTSSVDESMHTGESTPVLKEVGHHVIAGTMNGEGALTVRLTRLPGKNSITDIAGLVEAALSTKPRAQDLADKIAGYFTPIVIIIAVVAFVIWIAVSLKIRGVSGGNAIGNAITYSIAVLAVSCPCALGLAVPMVLVIAGGLGARFGVIIKRADATQRGRKVTDVVFDKTGTLTHGRLCVQESIFLTNRFSKMEIDSVTHSLIKDNNHPVSVAIQSFLHAQHVPLGDIDSPRSVPGKGLEADWKGKKIQAGNPYWLEVSEHPQIISRTKLGETLFCVTIESLLVAVYCLRTTLRHEALSVVHELNARGISCHIVSGDGPETVSNIALTLGIPARNAMSRHSPADKQDYVQRLMDNNKYVLFCGDGTNDAVAVAQAHIGVQIGNASDVTKATADVVLLGGLDGIIRLLDISNAAFRRIIFNFAWSAIYNVFAILLAAGAFVTVRIPPAFAGLGEIVSVLPVVLVALTLLL